MSPTDLRPRAKAGADSEQLNKKSSESERRQRYLQSAVSSSVIALRFLVEKQRELQRLPQEL